MEYTIERVIWSEHIVGVGPWQQALDWMNRVRIDGWGWGAWIRAVTHYYNGCVPGRCQVFTQRYDKATGDMWADFGATFWGPGYGPRGRCAIRIVTTWCSEPRSGAQARCGPTTWSGATGAPLVYPRGWSPLCR